MKALLTVGCPHSGHDQVFDLLGQAGVDHAMPCRKNSYSPQALQEQLLRTREVDLQAGGALEQVHPGKFWNELATDLFLTNIDQAIWGWADHQTAVLMDFWLDFDPQVRALLVYNPPEVYLERALRDNEQPSPQLVDKALQQWLRWNTALLRYSHRHAERCVLVNSQQAIAQPSVLIGMLASQWQIDGMHATAAFACTRQPSRNLSVHLIRQLIDERHPVWALIQEIDGVALLPASSYADGDAGFARSAHFAWADWVQVRTALALGEQTVATQTAVATGVKHENDELLLQLNHVKDELQQHLSIYQELKEEQLTSAAIASERELTLSALQLKVDQMLKERAQSTNSEVSELKQESELMLLQLHQVQEELEHYFLHSQQLEKQQTATANSFEANFWRIHPPEVLRIDMRLGVAGANWYPAEADGRWAGPNTYATLQMPPLEAGDYTIELDVVDAMDTDIVCDMLIEALGQSLTVQVDRPLLEDAYPLTCKTKIRIAESITSESWSLGLRFPRLVSPADSGSDDQRKLAIRLRTLRLARST